MAGAITDFLASNAVVGSKSEATRLIRGGGVSINGDRVSDEKATASSGGRDLRQIFRDPQRQEGQFSRARLALIDRRRLKSVGLSGCLEA